MSSAELNAKVAEHVSPALPAAPAALKPRAAAVAEPSLAGNKRRTTLAAFVIIFSVLLALPLLQTIFRPFHEKPLYGIATPQHFPALNRTAFLSEKYQKAVEDWALKQNGFWPLLVRCANQIYFSVFRQISGDYGSSVQLGREGHLFQPMYLKSFNRSKELNIAKLERNARRLRELQDELAKRGVLQVMLISSNVLGLYPELLPESYTDSTRLSRQSSYQIMRPLLDRYGVNYFDAHEYLTGIKDQFPTRFFEKTGSHWNAIASCLVTNKLFEKIEAGIGKKLTHFPCEPFIYQYPPKSSDLDLLQIANLLLPSSAYTAAPYPVDQSSTDESAYKPKGLFVGTSFLFSIIDRVDDHQAFTANPLYFYFRQVRKTPHENFRTLNKKRINWNEVLSNDVIVLEINQASIGNIGFGFLGEALQELKKKGVKSPSTETQR